MLELVRKTLEIYLTQKRIIAQGEFPADLLADMNTQDSVFVTLYHQGRVIASSGRIQCKKENTLYECIDNTLQCLKDERFSASLQSQESLKDISIRTDRFNASNRRVLPALSDLDISREGILFLSQNLGAMAIILPHMVNVNQTPDAYFSLVCQKAGVDREKLTTSDYVIYGVSTVSVTDMN